MLRNSGARNGEQARELVNRDRPTGQLLKDGHSSCVGERIESGLKVSVH